MHRFSFISKRSDFETILKIVSNVGLNSKSSEKNLDLMKIAFSLGLKETAIFICSYLDMLAKFIFVMEDTLIPCRAHALMDIRSDTKK